MLPGNEQLWRNYLLEEDLKLSLGVDELSPQQTKAAEKALILMLPKDITDEWIASETLVAER